MDDIIKVPGARDFAAPILFMPTFREQIATTALTVTKFRELVRKMRSNRPHDDLEIVKKAYEFSLKHHTGQTRASGEPYLVHPLQVAQVLADMMMDPVAIAAGLLHDSVEDTSVTIVDIRKEFGEQVAHIVEGVTKISKIDFATREEAQAENLRKMMLAMIDDIRVVLIKLADRLHNMRTLEHLPPDRQQKIAKETLEIYGPIAHRLGMGKIRGELEDLGFRYLDPIAYQQLHDVVESRRKQGEQFLERMESTLREKLKEAGITASVSSRIKRLFSIHKKLQRQRITVDQVYDLFAMRVITRSLQDCYAVLGIVHNVWRPVPGRIKDFIAMPRPNLYQSLHTSVITEDGTPVRNSDPHRRDAQDGGRGHRGALEVQGRRGVGAGRTAAGVAAAGGGVAARCFRSQRISCRRSKSTSIRKRFTPSRRKGRSWCCRAKPRRSISPTPCIRKWATPAWARRLTGAWCRCGTACTAGTSSKS